MFGNSLQSASRFNAAIVAAIGLAPLLGAAAAYSMGAPAASAAELRLALSRLWIPLAALLSALAVSLGWAWALRREVRRRRTAEARLIQARDRAEQLARVRQDFLVVAAHEVRAPVHAIGAAINRLAQLVRDPAQRELVRIARRSADSLGEFVGNVLDLSKDESGRMALEPQPDDLAALVRDVAGGFALFAAERGNMLTFQQQGPVPACLRFDAMRVRQIVANLISNALKFTEGGRIDVLLAARRRPAADPWCEVQITVSDDGIGITPEQQRRLFEPYAQFATGSASRFGGIGLGLAICKRLAESMAGSIRIRSEWRKGTSATVRLMLGVCGFEGAGTPDRRPPRVLIACCDRVQQVLLTTTLRRVGLDADLAVDAGEALERWHDRRHDLVLLDCDADPAAVRVLARRLLHEGLPAQRLVGLSAAAGAGVAGQAGIATVLPRPASAAQLWQAIASALRPQSAPAAGSGRGRCQTPTDEPTTQEVCFGR